MGEKSLLWLDTALELAGAALVFANAASVLFTEDALVMF